MSNNVDYFSVNADDVPRARTFYEAVFGWRFEPWGPPGFYLIDTGKDAKTPAPIRGGLQERRELVPGQRMVGYECTITVPNIDQAIRAVEVNGGRIAAPRFHIPTVGTVAYFIDTEGNVAGIIQRESA
jgi:predicted enzyme related to lactoylglutathione lyase